jgi:hypothetical protein
MFRVIILLTQVAITGSIEDYREAGRHEVVSSLRSMFTKDWETYANSFREERDVLLQRFHDSCEAE